MPDVGSKYLRRGQLGDATMPPPPPQGAAIQPLVAPPGAQTQMNILHAPLRALARHLAPHKWVIDCGGMGQCGPNTCAYLLGLANLFDGDGVLLRQSVEAYVSVADHLHRRTNCHRLDTLAPFTLGELILDCLAHWPSRARGNLEVSVASWASMIAKPETWTDLAFLHVVCDIYKVGMTVTVVTDLSEINELGTLMPCEDAPARRMLEVGMWWNRHLVAIANAPTTAAAAGASSDPPPALNVDNSASSGSPAPTDNAPTASPPPAHRRLGWTPPAPSSSGAPSQTRASACTAVTAVSSASVSPLVERLPTALAGLGDDAPFAQLALPFRALACTMAPNFVIVAPLGHPAR